MYILFRYGHVHLGHPDTINDPPEFTTLSYMCMCFTSGIASGFFAVSVSQTIWNQQSHFYANAGYRSQDELDMFAINMTVTQWGFAGWTKYLVVAVNMSLAVHCFQLPMTIRSCFYPILRHYTWGWMGDWIDGLAIVASITGVAVSMGLGAVQIVSGFIYMGWVDRNASQQQISSIQAATIWLITVLFTASTLSGLHGGVRFISKVALSCNFIFTFLIFALDDSKFLLNLIVQEFGYYFQYSIFQLNFWTDAFGQLREGSGRAIDGKAADQNWMDEVRLYLKCVLVLF
jgi:choline/glycine/proline betaine transport protein